jgi:hypothetical protein
LKLGAARAEADGDDDTFTAWHDISQHCTILVFNLRFRALRLACPRFKPLSSRRVVAGGNYLSRQVSLASTRK